MPSGKFGGGDLLMVMMVMMVMMMNMRLIMMLCCDDPSFNLQGLALADVCKEHVHRDVAGWPSNFAEQLCAAQPAWGPLRICVDRWRGMSLIDSVVLLRC